MSTDLLSNVDHLSRDELVSLLKRTTAERDAAIRENNNNSNKKKLKTTATGVVVPVADAGSTFNAAATKKRLIATSIKAIKKSVHNFNKKPWTEIFDSVPTEQAARQLFGNILSSDTKRMCELVPGDMAHEWMGSEFIHPVKSDQKYPAMFGPVKDHAWARIEEFLVMYDKATKQLTLKFLTRMVSNNPPHPIYKDAPADIVGIEL